MSWPRDDAKLDRVRALMAEQELDALVVRAPDNVLYLTNFWGMKGYDAVVFPREGEPVLICLEASEADAERMSWTRDVRLFRGYDESRPAAAGPARARPGAPDRLRVRPRRDRAEPRHAGGRPDGRRADDLSRRRGSTPFRTRPTRRRSSPPRARSRPSRRSSGCGSRTRSRPARWSTSRRDPARDARERGRGDVERLGPRPRHGLDGEGRARARLLAHLVRRRDPHVHGDRQPADRGARADAVRDLGLRRRLLVRPHEEPRPRRARPALRRARAAADGMCTHAHVAPFGRARAWPSSTGRSARPLAEIGYPGQPSHPICHGVGARAHEPPYAHQAGGGTVEAGMVLAIEPGVYWPEGGGPPRRGQLPDHRERAGALCRFPDGIVRAA